MAQQASDPDWTPQGSKRHLELLRADFGGYNTPAATLQWDLPDNTNLDDPGLKIGNGLINVQADPRFNEEISRKVDHAFVWNAYQRITRGDLDPIDGPNICQIWAQSQDGLFFLRIGEWLNNDSLFHLTERLLTYSQDHQAARLGTRQSGHWFVVPDQYFLQVFKKRGQPAQYQSWALGAVEVPEEMERLRQRFLAAKLILHIINHPNHWALVIYQRSSNMLYYLDSDSNDRATRARRARRAFKDWLAKSNLQDVGYTNRLHVVKLLGQQNQWSCGLHVILNAMAVVRYECLDWRGITGAPVQNSTGGRESLFDMRKDISNALHRLMGLYYTRLRQIADDEKKVNEGDDDDDDEEEDDEDEEGEAEGEAEGEDNEDDPAPTRKFSSGYTIVKRILDAGLPLSTPSIPRASQLADFRQDIHDRYLEREPLALEPEQFPTVPDWVRKRKLRDPTKRVILWVAGPVVDSVGDGVVRVGGSNGSGGSAGGPGGGGGNTEDPGQRAKRKLGDVDQGVGNTETGNNISQNDTTTITTTPPSKRGKTSHPSDNNAHNQDSSQARSTQPPSQTSQTRKRKSKDGDNDDNTPTNITASRSTVTRTSPTPPRRRSPRHNQSTNPNPSPHGTVHVKIITVTRRRMVSERVQDEDNAPTSGTLGVLSSLDSRHEGDDKQEASAGIGGKRRNGTGLESDKKRRKVG